jgi:hypothetical protein
VVSYKPPMTTQEKALEEKIQALEKRFLESAEELKDIRLKLLRGAQAELDEIQDEWHGVHYKWWVITLSGVLALFVLAYSLYTNAGWHADHSALPSGSDWLLRRLPVVNVLPMLSWGWLGLHLTLAGAAVLYYPRRMPFLLFMLGVFVAVRSVFIFLSPIGHPTSMLDVGKLDFLYSQVLGTWTFNNEFVFSGHAGVPFLFFLFFETFWLKTTALVGSLTMGACVLLSHNHYTVDVLGAYFVSYSIFCLSERLYYGYLRPLFQVAPSKIRY